ncbi:hypothetical protein GCM10010360_65430 [Streptomyces nogalater]
MGRTPERAHADRRPGPDRGGARERNVRVYAGTGVRGRLVAVPARAYGSVRGGAQLVRQ